MAYLVMARKWRPAVFEDVVAQSHVTETLQNAVRSDRIAHAYLFCGPRGVGKTTTARIFAKALNCVQGPTPTPCNNCTPCAEIAAGRSIDVLEIDGASNRGIDDVKNLRENVKYAPSQGKYKIYIIDEVHMLTKEAFNALLKTLEEPPSHVLFLFATTEPHKMPATILSRCQRFDFKRIATSVIADHLASIAEAEGIVVDQEALLAISRRADGSLRDAQGLLDQLVSFAEGKIDVAAVSTVLGWVTQEVYFEVTDLIARQAADEGLWLVDRIVSQGYDLQEFALGLVGHLRNLLVSKISPEATDLLEVSSQDLAKYRHQTRNFREEDLVRLIRIASDMVEAVRGSAMPRIDVELGLIRMARLESSVLLQDILNHLHTMDAGQTGDLPAPQREVKTGEAERSREDTAPQPGPQATTDTAPKKSLGAKAQTVSQTPIGVASGNQHQAPRPNPSGQPNLARQTVQETPPVGATGDLAEVQRQWDRVIEGVKQQSKALGAFLSEGKPAALDGDVLTITFEPSYLFHREQAEKKAHKQIIEEVLKRILGCPLRMVCVLANPEQIPQAESGNGASPPKSTDQLAHLMEQEPILHSLIQAFEGEVITDPDMDQIRI